MFSEINVCSGITEELEMADTLSNTPLLQTEVGFKQNACDVFEKENEDEIAFSSDDIKLSTGYLNIKDCNEYKDERAISSEGNDIETDTGNKHLSQTILSYLYTAMIDIHYCIINILGIIKPFCPKGHVMEIKDESEYSRCDGCKRFKNGEQWHCRLEEGRPDKKSTNLYDDEDDKKHLTYCFDCVSDQGTHPLFSFNYVD